MDTETKTPIKEKLKSYIPSFSKKNKENQETEKKSKKKYIIFSIVAILILIYPAFMISTHQINDNLDFKAPETKGSKAVAMTSALISREINDTNWVANDPWFMPGARLDNMTNYQQGLIYGTSRFILELSDSIGRVRGSSQVDDDLDTAVGRIRFPGTSWVWNPSVSIWPQSPAEEQYQDAVKALNSYNERVANGSATFDKRADNLIATIERISSDLGSSSATLEKGIQDSGGIFDTDADDVLYQVKGRLYAYHQILQELGKDFKPLLEEKKAENVWQNMLDSMAQGAKIKPFIVSNTETSDMMFNTHLSSMGFYLLLARTQLKEISIVLSK